MPMYVYTCADCNKSFERLVFSQNPDVACDCGSQKVQKAITTFAVATGNSCDLGDSGSCPSGGSCASGGCGHNH